MKKLILTFLVLLAGVALANPSKVNTNIQWEQINQATESRFAIFRTSIPEGWLVSIGSGNCAVIVKDPEHRWGANLEVEAR